MTSTRTEQRLVDAFREAKVSIDPHPDLFVRVERSIEDARMRSRFRMRLGAGLAAFVCANALLGYVLSHLDTGRSTMPWWVIELITNIVLVALATGLGPFIKRFGRAYAADVFRANPRTGKSYLVLTDVAYYLIFTSFVLFTVTLVAPDNWEGAAAEQVEHELARIGGILLMIGVLHAANVVALPIIGRLLASRRADESPPQGGAHPVLPPGSWIVRVEGVGPPTQE